MKQFVEICSNLKEAVYNLCGINVTKPVDMTVGAYLLNDTHKHTERVYVNTTATLSGTLQTIITGTNVSFNFASIVAINWASPSSYAVEFGNGYTDLGGNPTFNFVNEPDGRYTLKVYRLFRFTDNDKYFLIAEIEIDKVGSLLTVASTNPVTINRSITYTSSEGLQSYCNGIPVGSILPISPKLDPENEWLGQTDANNSSLNNHTETLCDVVTATFGGTLNGTIAGTVYTLNAGAVTLANDTLINYFVDWGNGITDIGLIFTYDFVNQPSSKYEPKLYGITTSGQIIFISAIEINWNGTTLSNITTFPVSISRTYQRVIGKAFQNYIGSVPNGLPYTSLGTYTPTGTLTPNCPEFRNDFLGVADATNGTNGAPIVTSLENSSANRITGAQALGTTIITNPAFIGSREVIVYNQYNTTVQFQYTTTVNGVLHTVNIPRGGTFEKTLKRDDYTNEGTYTSGRIVFGFAAGTIGTATSPNELNINWTT